MLTWHPGYKVCRLRGSVRISCIAQYSSALYIPGRVTKPHRENGPLAVFSDYKQAVNFMTTISSGIAQYAIYPCAYTKAGKRHGVKRDSLYYRYKDNISVTTYETVNPPLYRISSLIPSTTEFANRVILLSEEPICKS